MFYYTITKFVFTFESLWQLRILRAVDFSYADRSALEKLTACRVTGRGSAIYDISPESVGSITDEQTIICSQLFVGHLLGSGPTKRKGRMHRIINPYTIPSFSD